MGLSTQQKIADAASTLRNLGLLPSVSSEEDLQKLLGLVLKKVTKDYNLMYLTVNELPDHGLHTLKAANNANTSYNNFLRELVTKI